MNWLLNVLIIFALAVHVIPPGLHLTVGSNRLQAIMATAIVAVLQVMLFGFGRLMGGTFLHLVEGMKTGILFFTFFLVGVRMAMEAFKIRKGDVVMRLDNTKLMVLTGVAQGIDAFLVGMMFYFFPEVKLETILIALFLMASFLMMPAIYTGEKKGAYSFVSLLYLVGALVFVFSSLYFLFIV
jgi:putative Mn2+ efflux pump MntP